MADDYSLLATGLAQGQVAMGAIPYLMHDRPFVQGITASAEIGQKIGAVDAPSNRRQRAARPLRQHLDRMRGLMPQGLS